MEEDKHALGESFTAALKLPEGIPVVEADDEMLIGKREEFRHSLVGRFLTDRPLNLGYAKNTILKAWRCKASVNTVDLEGDIILF